MIHQTHKLSARRTTALFLALSLATWLLSLGIPNLAHAVPLKKKELRELHTIGEIVSQGIVRKDIEEILRYDRPDLIESDRHFLLDKKSDLYCYLFDTSCIKRKGRSVYEIFSKAKKLTITSRDLGRGKEGYRYAILYFFDSTEIDQQKLASAEYLCEKGGQHIVTWMFRYVKGKWESAHPPFDAETDVYCSPD